MSAATIRVPAPVGTPVRSAAHRRGPGAAARPVVDPPHGSGLRLTRRGRRLVRVTAVLLVVGALFSSGRAVAEQPAPAVSVDSYTVGSGESLWSIAAALTAPGEDVRDTVDLLGELNGMTGTSLAAGEQILVPVAG